MRYLFALAAVALVCGCICCGGVDLGGVGSSTDTTEPYCTPPYIQVGSSCCLDRNSNGVCDTQETPATTVSTQPASTVSTQAPVTTQAPHTTLTPTTTQPPATTLPAVSCSDGVQNQGEEYIDCGGPCTECEVFTLKSAWKEFKNTGYKFRFDDKEGSGDGLKYWIKIETPDGIEDRRYITTGENFVDYLRFKVINYGEDQPKMYMKINTEDLASVPPQATLLTIGGQSCTQMGSEMCERNYAGYTIRMINRLPDGGAKISIVGPSWEVPYNTDVLPDKLSYAPDNALVVAGFFDRGHIMTGGYSLFYLYLR